MVRNRVDSDWGGLKPVYVSPSPKFGIVPRQRAVNRAYLELVRKLGYDVDEALKFRVDGWVGYRCPAENCEVEAVYYPVIRCGRLHPYVSYKHSSRAAANVFERLQAVGCDNVICFDLTIDAVPAKNVGAAAVREMYAAADEFLKVLYSGVYPNKDGKFGGWASVHIWHTKLPIFPKLHLHIVIPNVVWDGKRFIRINSKFDIRLVRLAWKVVAKKHGWMDEHQTPNLRVRYIPMEKRSEVIARLQYMFRRPVEDLNYFLCESHLKWKNIDWDVVMRILNYSPRLRALGFCKRLKKLGVLVPKFCGHLCPICGSRLFETERIKKLPADVPLYALKPDGKLEKIDGWGS